MSHSRSGLDSHNLRRVAFAFLLSHFCLTFHHLVHDARNRWFCYSYTPSTKIRCQLHPRIKNHFANLILLEKTIALWRLTDANDLVYQTDRITNSPKYILAFYYGIIVSLWSNHKPSNVPNKSNAIGNMALAGHRPKSNETFLLYS